MNTTAPMNPTTIQKARSTCAADFPYISTRRTMPKPSPLMAAILLLLAWAVPVGAQTLAPSPYLTAFDNSGNIVAGACIWTTSAGTTTPIATYTDSALSVPNANPIIADSAGRYVAYLTAGASYKFVVENIPCSAVSHGTTLKTVDNIKAVPTADTTAARQLAEGRLTLTSGTSVTITDVSAAATIYYTPHTGNRIALYDGSASWNVRTFTEVSLSIASCTASKPYDVWLYDNAGTVTAEMLVWTNTTTRATALTRQDGIYVKTGDSTRRYVGTFFCNSTGGQTDDTTLKRFLYSYYNRVPRTLLRFETTANWTYTTATWRQANGATANKVEFIVGVAEDTVAVRVTAATSSTGANARAVSLGLDSTSAPSAAATIAFVGMADTATLPAAYQGIPGVGYHFLAWLEHAQAAGTATWYGITAPTALTLQLGIVGEIKE